jgi:hypothetical protein
VDDALGVQRCQEAVSALQAKFGKLENRPPRLTDLGARLMRKKASANLAEDPPAVVGVMVVAPDLGAQLSRTKSSVKLVAEPSDGVDAMVVAPATLVDPRAGQPRSEGRKSVASLPSIVEGSQESEQASSAERWEADDSQELGFEEGGESVGPCTDPVVPRDQLYALIADEAANDGSQQDEADDSQCS